MNSVHFKRILCALLCMVTVATVVNLPSVSPAKVEAKSISDYQSELDAARAEANKIKAEINSLKKENAPYQEQKAAIERSIAATQAEIDLYQEQIDACEATIAERTAELNESKEKFKQRLVAMYTSTDNTGLAVLLSSADYSDYLAQAELIDTVTRKDLALINEIIDAVKELETANAVLATAKAEIDAKKAELQAQFDEVNAIVEKYENKISQLNADAAKKAKEEQEILNAIKKAQQQQSSNKGDSNPSVIVGTGKFAWPVPKYYTISSKFGWRWGRNHNGVDIASNNGTVYGATIVAADSGTVIMNKYYSGYGWYVAIDHGNGYTTHYAHMKAQSTLAVGSKVTKGKSVVGYVGASGNVTGPHLHFEIRYNGTPKDPMSFYN